jgi:hypothetical protein
MGCCSGSALKLATKLANLTFMGWCCCFEESPTDLDYQWDNQHDQCSHSISTKLILSWYLEPRQSWTIEPRRSLTIESRRSSTMSQLYVDATPLIALSTVPPSIFLNIESIDEHHLALWT